MYVRKRVVAIGDRDRLERLEDALEKVGVEEGEMGPQNVVYRGGLT